MRRNAYITGLIIAVAIFSAAIASARPNELKGAVPITVTPSDTAITSDDRWLFVAGDGGVEVIDTATFEVVEKLEDGMNVVAVGISSNDSYLFVLKNNGWMETYSLSSLDSVGPGETVAITSPVSEEVVDFSMYGSPLDMVVGPYPQEESDTSKQFIFIAVSNDQVDQVLVFTQLALLNGNPFEPKYTLDIGGTPVNLAYTKDMRTAHLDSSDYTLFVSYENGMPGITLYSVQPPTSEAVIFDDYGDFNHGDASSLAGLAASYYGDYVAMGNMPTALLLSNVDDLAPALGIAISDHDTASSVALNGNPKAIEWFFSENNEDVFYVATANSELNIVNASNGNNSIISLGAGIPASANASTNTDDYFYVADDGGEVQVVTANPWISNLSWTPMVNNGVQNTTVSFHTDEAGTFEVLRGGTIRGDGTAIVSSSNVSTGQDVNFTITPSNLSEGMNDIYIFVEDDSGDVGRLGFMLEKNSVPRAPSFRLSFGDKKIYVIINTLGVAAGIEHYVVYYSTAKPDLKGDLGGSVKKYIDDFVPGNEKKVTIDDVKNGQTYYFRVRAHDGIYEGELSGIKSIMAQGTSTYSESTGDSSSCLAVSPGREVSVFGAAVMFMFWAVIFVLMRRQILRSRRVK